MKRSGGKWAITILLLCVAAALWWWPNRPVKIELLPFSTVPPPWDGSQPWLIISLVSGSKPAKLNVEIALVKPTVRHVSPVNEFVVNLRNGNFKLLQTDLFVPDVMPLCLTRTYFAWNPSSRAFGIGMNHPYDICPTGTRFPYTYMNLNLEDGYEVYMPRISKGTGYADAVFRHDRSASEFFGAQVAWNGNGWTMKFADGSKIFFPEAYYAKNFAQGAPTEMLDAEGHRIQLQRNSRRNLEELISPSGHTINFKYDSADRITEANDDAGDVRRYSYDRTGHLDWVSDGSKVLYRFEYQRLMGGPDNDPYLVTAVLDGDWNVLIRNRFLNGRVSEQTLADGRTYKYEYQFRGTELIQTTVTFPDKEKKTFSFRNGILTSQR
jgi:YD repeat-containing protein